MSGPVVERVERPVVRDLIRLARQARDGTREAFEVWNTADPQWVTLWEDREETWQRRVALRFRAFDALADCFARRAPVEPSFRAVGPGWARFWI